MARDPGRKRRAVRPGASAPAARGRSRRADRRAALPRSGGMGGRARHRGRAGRRAGRPGAPGPYHQDAGDRGRAGGAARESPGRIRRRGTRRSRAREGGGGARLRRRHPLSHRALLLQQRAARARQRPADRGGRDPGRGRALRQPRPRRPPPARRPAAARRAARAHLAGRHRRDRRGPAAARDGVRRGGFRGRGARHQHDLGEARHPPPRTHGGGRTTQECVGVHPGDQSGGAGSRKARPRRGSVEPAEAARPLASRAFPLLPRVLLPRGRGPERDTLRGGRARPRSGGRGGGDGPPSRPRALGRAGRAEHRGTRALPARAARASRGTAAALWGGGRARTGAPGASRPARRGLARDRGNQRSPRLRSAAEAGDRAAVWESLEPVADPSRKLFRAPRSLGEVEPACWLRPVRPDFRPLPGEVGGP